MKADQPYPLVKEKNKMKEHMQSKGAISSQMMHD